LFYYQKEKTSIKNETVKNFYSQDYKNRIFKLGFNRNKGTANSNVPSVSPITIDKKTKIESILEKVILLSSFNPEILGHSDIEEFLQNIEISNKKLESVKKFKPPWMKSLVSFKLLQKIKKL